MSNPRGAELGVTAHLSDLPERGKAPQSASILTKWVDAEEKARGMAGGQLRWLIASSVVAAALQRAVDSNERPRFRLKGGTYLRYLLDWSGRPTKDIDGIIAGDIESFLTELDDALAQPWGPLTLRRGGQIAQKLHACTDPHDPPHSVNDRARDVVDLVLLRRFINDNGGCCAPELLDAAQDIFASRAAEAAQLNRTPRTWPPVVVAYPGWRTDYASAATKARLDVTLEEAVAMVNDWIDEIAAGIG